MRKFWRRRWDDDVVVSDEEFERLFEFGEVHEDAGIGASELNGRFLEAAERLQEEAEQLHEMMEGFLTMMERLREAGREQGK